MKVHVLGTLWLWMLAAVAEAQVAGAYESFTNRANAESWSVYDYADRQWYYPSHDSAGDGQNADIYLTFSGANSLDFSADAFSSEGAFVGDLVAAGIDAIGCDFYVEDPDSFSFAEFYLYSTAENRYYYGGYFTAEYEGWNGAYTNLRDIGVWYVYEDDDYRPVELTDEILSQVTEIGMSFHPLNVAHADGKLVALDNFTTYGKYVLPQLATRAQEGQFKLNFECQPGIGYSILASSDLSNWTEVEGEQIITGNSPYEFTQALSAGSRFFKVEIEDVLTPVSDVNGS